MPNHPDSTLGDAAEDVSILIDYLRAEDDGTFLYRGQTRDYPGPLVPSTFRTHLDPLERYGPGSVEFVRRIRKLGNSFVGNYARSQPVIRDPDWLDRMTIRQRLLNTFGYALGSALAQHFGLQSEHLDVTTDLNVAAFFATHVGPRYETVGLRDQLEDGGVIFRVPRLPLPQGDVLNDWDYFGAPGTMVYADVVHPFEQHVSIADSLDSLRVYYELRRTTGERNSRLLKLPHDCLTDSRMGRQAAAAVIPDEIHVATRGIFCSPPYLRLRPPSRRDTAYPPVDRRSSDS